MTLIISSSCLDVVNNIYGGARHDGSRASSFHRGSATISMGTKLFSNVNDDKVLVKNEKDLNSKSITSSASDDPAATKKKTQTGVVVDHGNKKGMYGMYLEVIPQPIRFFISTSIGNVAFFALDQYFYTNVFIGKDTASFFVAYLIQILLQHSLNAFFVYGIQTISTRLKYTQTLTSTYTAYFGTLVASTCFNSLLIRYTPIPKTVAFWTTLAIFGIVNFFLLGKLVEGSPTIAGNNEIIASSSIEKNKNIKKNTLKNNRGGATSSTTATDWVHAIFQKDDKQHLSKLIFSLFLPHQSSSNNNSVSFRGQF